MEAFLAVSQYSEFRMNFVHAMSVTVVIYSTKTGFMSKTVQNAKTALLV